MTLEATAMPEETFMPRNATCRRAAEAGIIQCGEG